VTAALMGNTREIVLTGVQLGSWGQDLDPKLHLGDLLSRLLNETDVQRLRLSSLEPWDLEQPFFSLWKDPRLCRHLHLPLQSGDDRILHSMRRKYTAAGFADFIMMVYQTVPDIGIGVDVMVGYPGEGEREFINTKKLLADLPVSYYHIFPYSDRKGTGSCKLQPKVPYQAKKMRTRIMIEQGQRKKFTFYERHLGTTTGVLFEQQHADGNWLGYTTNYMSVEVNSAENLHNKILPVFCTGLNGRNIIGKLKN